MTRLDEIPYQRIFPDVLGGNQGDHGLLDLSDPPPLQGRDPQAGDSVGPAELLGFRRRKRDIPLVEGHKDRYLTTLQVRQESPVSIAQPGLVGDEEGDVRPPENLETPLDPLRPQGGEIVQAGGVHEGHRSQGEKFIALVHRIGGRPRFRRDDGDLLPGEGVDQ